MDKYILALDQGTTSSRAILFDLNGSIVRSVQYQFPQIYPQPGWVEHDPYAILNSQYGSVRDVLDGIDGEVAAIGITNQRETSLVWEKATGKPVYNAVVWQCRRTAPECELLIKRGFTEHIKSTTGLNPDAYFSGTKYKWILNNVPRGVQRAKDGELLCGTVDSWLIWNLTGGKVHATDVTNASRTMLYDINNLKYDDILCSELGIPLCSLPEVRDTAGSFGVVDKSARLPECLSGVPIFSAVGDQQAALFGQMCFSVGDVKNTYGTGCFTLMNIGTAPVFDAKLLTTVGWRIGGRTVYALEGSVFNAGSSIQWLRDELGIIKHAHDCDILAESVPDSGGAVFVSAFTGLGAPYWDMYARGSLLGITRGTGKAHICRAVLEGIANQVCDLVSAMEDCCGRKIGVLRVDGGASVSDFLMQYQADMLGIAVERPAVTETTALGAALLAGVGAGLWRSADDISAKRRTEMLFAPVIDAGERARRRAVWHDAVNRSMGFAKQ